MSSRSCALTTALLIVGGLSLPAFASAATYYVDATGGSDGNSGTDTSHPWKTIAKVSSSAFAPGDSILFKRGETWRDVLWPSSSGAAGSPITFASYGVGARPRITASNAIVGWTVHSGSTYKAPFSYWGFAFNARKNGVPLIEASSLASMPDQSYFWASNVLYIKDTTGSPSGHVIEVSARDNAVYTNNQSYLTFDGLEIDSGESSTFTITRGSSHIIVANNDIHDNSRFAYQRALFVLGHDNTISGNLVHDNDGNSLVLSGSAATNNIVEKNLVYNNMRLVDDSGGIESGFMGTGNIIRYNRIYNNGTATTRCAGIMIDYGSAPAIIYGNVTYSNSNGGIAVATGGHVIYNNTMYHDDVFGAHTSAEMDIFDAGDATPNSNITFKNNIVVGGPSQTLFGAYATPNGFVLDNNLYYGGSAAPFYWNGANTTFSNYKTASGQDAHSLYGNDPKFTVAGSVFTLQSSSPAIDAGANLGATYQLALAPGSTWPASVTTANQDSNEAGWEIGAYIYTGAPLAPHSTPPPPLRSRRSG